MNNWFLKRTFLAHSAGRRVIITTDRPFFGCHVVTASRGWRPRASEGWRRESTNDLEQLLDVVVCRRADGQEVALSEFLLAQVLPSAEAVRAEEIDP